MNGKWIFRTLFLCGAVALLGGCSTLEERELSGLEASRAFAVANLPDLNESQIAYIKFASPELQTRVLFPMERKDIESFAQQESTFFRPYAVDFTSNRRIESSGKIVYYVWLFPDSLDAVYVFGTADKRFYGFTPVRAVHRPLLPADPAKLLTLRRARNFVLQNIPTLTGDTDRDRLILEQVRFAPPRVYETAFIPAEERASLLAKRPNMNPEWVREYSLVWPCGDDASRVLTVTMLAESDFYLPFAVRADLREAGAAGQGEAIPGFTALSSSRASDHTFAETDSAPAL